MGWFGVSARRECAVSGIDSDWQPWSQAHRRLVQLIAHRHVWSRVSLYRNLAGSTAAVTIDVLVL